ATRPPAVRKTALSISAIIEAALLIVLSLAPSAWLTWVAALFLGAVVGLLMSINPFTNEKPWRRVGIPAAVLVFVSCAFQILGRRHPGARLDVVAGGHRHVHRIDHHLPHSPTRSARGDRDDRGLPRAQGARGPPPGGDLESVGVHRTLRRTRRHLHPRPAHSS